MNTQERTVDNGVNVEALLGAREALTEAPEAAAFKWRATSEWVSGTHSRATVEGFFGLGEEHKHRQAFQFDADHPEIFAAEDNGATPVEFILVGLAGCLSAGIASVAQNRNIQLRSVKATQDEIAALVAQSQKRSAVFDVVTNPTDVTVTASKA